MAGSRRHDVRWWQNGVVYEIDPRSFANSNGDGIGDLPGITARLDHLAWLGVDAIWIASARAPTSGPSTWRPTRR